MSLPLDELKAIVFLNALTLNRPAQRRNVIALLGQGLTPRQVLAGYGNGKGENENLRNEWRHGWDAEREIESCEVKGIQIVTCLDEDYPMLLKEIEDPPLLIYMRGTLEKTDESALAIVGTRHPSLYGISQAKRFGKELAEMGLTIVSGFARGVDQIAHEAALQVPYGRTLAVLGCGIDVDYPRDSRDLFARVEERGAILSECPLGMLPRAENFPQRNRIIAGLSQGVLVVEAALRSGALITAHSAADEGRDVFAIPGPVHHLTSRGTNRLIKEGASLVESPTEVFEILSLGMRFRRGRPQPKGEEKTQKATTSEVSTSQQEEGDTVQKREKDEILRLLDSAPLSGEELLCQANIPPAQAASLITQLELAGCIHRQPDGRFSKRKSVI